MSTLTHSQNLPNAQAQATAGLIGGGPVATGPTLSTIELGITEAHKRIENLVGSLETIISEIRGPQLNEPGDIMKPVEVPAPAGMLARMDQSLSCVHERIDKANLAINKLKGLI